MHARREGIRSSPVTAQGVGKDRACRVSVRVGHLPVLDRRGGCVQQNIVPARRIPLSSLCSASKRVFSSGPSPITARMPLAAHRSAAERCSDRPTRQSAIQAGRWQRVDPSARGASDGHPSSARAARPPCPCFPSRPVPGQDAGCQPARVSLALVLPAQEAGGCREGLTSRATRQSSLGTPQPACRTLRSAVSRARP